METTFVITALAALAQPTRLAIFRLLVVAGPTGLIVGKIAEQLNTPPATLSFHLKELSRAGLITPVQKGRFITYSANYQQMTELLSFLTENCCNGTACLPDAATLCCPD